MYKLYSLGSDIDEELPWLKQWFHGSVVLKTPTNSIDNHMKKVVEENEEIKKRLTQFFSRLLHRSIN